MRNLLELLWEEWKIIEQLIAVLSDELERIADADAGCSRLCILSIDDAALNIQPDPQLPLNFVLTGRSDEAVIRVSKES
jgi:hypothetical protein